MLFALAIILAVYLLGSALTLNILGTICVTELGEQNFTPDRMVREDNFTCESKDLKVA